MPFSCQHRVLPGFKLTLGFTLFYLCLIVLIPLAAIFAKSSALSWPQFWRDVASPVALAAYRLTFGASFLAALINAVFGLLVAWVLVRYRFWGRHLMDALVDLPFALPTAVAGITLAAVYAPNGWVGKWLAPYGIKVSYTQLGVFVALTFIGLPFVVRTVQPVIEDLDVDVEEAAASLGANRFKTFFRVILPMLFPALLTGFAMAFARALGEYGAVVFISSGKPFEQVISMLIMTKLEQFDYAGATALAVVMLVVSFLLLLAISFLQWWSSRHRERI
jgi:sulfate/thiosulfate transport system permease protein